MTILALLRAAALAILADAIATDTGGAMTRAEAAGWIDAGLQKIIARLQYFPCNIFRLPLS